MDEEDSKTLRQMAKGGGVLILGAFATKAIMYFYRILVAQELGADAYGVLSQGLAVFWIFMVLSNLGIGAGIQRRVSEYMGKNQKEKIPGVLWASLTMSLPLSLLGAVIMFFGADFLALQFFNDPELSSVLRIFALALPFQMLYKNGASLIKAFREMKYITYVDKLWRSLTTFIITAILIYSGWGIEGAVIAQFAAIATSGILIMYFAQFKVFPFLQRNINWEGHERKDLIKYSWPIFLSGAVGLSTSWADTILLGFYSVSGTVGIYNAAMPTAKMLMVFSAQMGNVIFPTVSEYYGKGEKEKSIELASIGIKWIFFFTFPGLIMMALFPSQILNLLFGSEFTGGAVALSILGTAYFIRTITVHAGSYINSEEMTQLQLYNSIFVSILNVVLNMLLIPGFKFGGIVIPELGLAGAAIATAFSLTLVSIIAVLEVYFLFDVQPYSIQRFLPATAATTVSAVLTYSVFQSIFETVPKLMLFPALLLFGTSYILLYILLGGISKNDLEIIRSIDNKTGTDFERIVEFIEKYAVR